MRQTTMAKYKESPQKWFVIDANSQVLGRLASFAATRLRGKHSPLFTPNVDMGDKIIIINAEKVLLTAKKEDQKLYYNHSGYPGGLRVRTAREMRAKKPIALVERAIYGMIPHTKLGDKQRRNLYVYSGSTHPHAGQNPTELEVNN
ncbi:50S ribosomal protein L13 [Mycoplasma sp. 'Moose RK']|uniref:50S ribosomal protein L13 n=1 Tax=Mycoplasma sp. 'Moose RK' TaxID=2780095 RepID=UPI0018C212F3|nr:50S ribosomal protein L13 [Mycoplasma sp. 'Moose RK']MBG0730604.1 50S ribosomal protein L13 [Mycoplasma sp. 'Moose RK']